MMVMMVDVVLWAVCAVKIPEAVDWAPSPTTHDNKNLSENNLRPEYYNFFMPENRPEKVPHPLKLVGQNVQYRQ